MTLPNYFLADLPPEATLSAAIIREACQTLKHNREQFLRARPTASLVKLLASTAENWLCPDYPFRKLALEHGPAATGFTSETLASGLDSFFAQMTGEQILALLQQDLGHASRLDELAASPVEQKSRRAAHAHGPEFLVQIAAGNLPNPTLMSIVLGVLTRSAQFVKCATGTSYLPRLFAHSLYDADPKLGACLEIAEWPGGKRELEDALFAEADCVTATGGDETLLAIRQRLPDKIRFLGYGHRLSFGYITHEVLSGFGAKKVVARASDDVIAWDQLGCLSPHVFYVEHGQSSTAERFAEMLAEELARRETSAPRGALPIEAAAAIATRRSFYQVRAAHSEETKHWFSENSTAWSVILESDALFQTSCLHRFVYVKPVANLNEALQGADAVRCHVSTVGLAAPDEESPALALQLARWGAARVCPIGQMQKPPLTWRHDGRPGLGDLVAWSDFEL